MYALTKEEIITIIRQEDKENNFKNDSMEIQKVLCQEALNILEKLEIFGFNKKMFMLASNLPAS